MNFNEVTYEDITKACSELLTTNIKGKEYVQVNERVKAFRKVYPTGYINAEMISNAGGVCTFRASVGYCVYNEDGTVIRHTLATGTAYEKESSSYINKTSYIENCETSAIGRALGFAGFGIDTSIASSEEVVNAIEQQTRAETISPQEAEILEHILKDANVNIAAICRQYKVKRLTDLNTEQYTEINRKVSDWRETQNAQPQG